LIKIEKNMLVVDQIWLTALS